MEVVGYITTAIVVIFLCLWAIVVASATLTSFFRGKKSPRIAGTAIPETGENLDITKPYDIAYSGGDRGERIAERLFGVKIVGYVGREDDESVSTMYMPGRWLVVQFADGRRAYLLPQSIVSLQESAPA